MEQDFEINDTNELVDDKLAAVIEKKVKELKANDPSLGAVFPIVIEGTDYDEEEQYIGYFRQPTFKHFSKYLVSSTANQAGAMRQLAKDCFLDGHKELVDNDSLFLFGLMGQLSKIIEMRNGTLVNLSKTGK